MNARFVILNPCAKRWDKLEGDGRRRHCATCNTPVHAIDNYSPAEWAQVWHENDGHVCGYLNRPAPEPPRSRRAMLVGSFLMTVSPLFAQSDRVRIVIRATDGSGKLVLPSARASWVDRSGLNLSVRANDKGEILLTLPLGEAVVRVESDWFWPTTLRFVVSGTEPVILTAKLEFASEETKPVETVVAPVPQELPKTKPAPSAKRHRWWPFH